MAGQLSAHDHRFAYRKGNQPGDAERGIRNTCVRAVIPGGVGVRDRNSATYQEKSQVRPISILAALLDPFAGNRSDALAGQLIERFGTIQRLLAASDTQIEIACQGHPGAASRISGARALVFAGLQESVERSRVDPADPNLVRYLTLKFRGRPYEELHAIFVDHDRGFISEERVSIGTTGRVKARISNLLRRAIELGARGLLLVHNHPSEIPEPSIEDIRSTRHIKMVASALDVEIVDHLIIAGTKVVSMSRLNVL